MTDNIDVAIGVVEGRVIAKWKDLTREIAFDAPNAYRIGMALIHAAGEAHRGFRNGEMLGVLDAMQQNKIIVTDAKHDMLVAQVATIVRTLIEQGKTPGYIALHAVDNVLAETAR